MKSAEPSTTVSASELKLPKTAEGCLNMCGMCAPCVFAPEQPGFTQCFWKVSDEFKRKFVLKLLLRCRNVQVLENLQSALGVTSWNLLAYGRSTGPASLQHPPSRSAVGELNGKPLGINMEEIWDWFCSSPDWIKSRYLCRVLSRCDPELLRMASNLLSVLLVRQKRQFLQFNCKNTRETLLVIFNQEKKCIK